MPDAAWARRSNPHEQDYQTHTLLSVFRAWQALREKTGQLQGAQEESKAKQQRLNQRHVTLSAQVEKDKENREAAKQQAKGFAKNSKAASREESKASAKSALDSLKQYTRDQKNLADLGKRAPGRAGSESTPTGVGSGWSRPASERR